MNIQPWFKSTVSAFTTLSLTPPKIMKDAALTKKGITQIMGKEYEPVVIKAWKGLYNMVNEEGKLQWVQKVGHKPTMVHKEDTNEYASGAFLNAGYEMMKLINFK